MGGGKGTSTSASSYRPYGEGSQSMADRKSKKAQPAGPLATSAAVGQASVATRIQSP